MTLLEVRQIDAYYGQAHVLHQASLEIGERGRVALVGRNGAGKSTLLKSVLNAGPRVRGAIEFRGKPLLGARIYEAVRTGVMLVPEDRRILPHLTVRENIQLARHAAPAGRRPLSPEEIFDRIPLLRPLAERFGTQLSGGQQQMLAVARAVAARPYLMLLDEPTEGLAPIIVDQLADIVRKACEEDNIALLLCEQNLRFARKCTDYVYIIDSGRIVFEGDWPKFRESGDITRRYLAV
jgi:ABC-type branched-subunit amino acid transport system ATPase component